MREESNIDGSAIPWRSLLPVLAFRIIDGISYSVVFPFITEFIMTFDVPLDKVGLYAGTAEGMFMIVEAIVATTWARLADRYGRKPCLILGVTFVSLASCMVGLSGKVWHVIFWRGVGGLGPIPVLAKIVVGEITQPSNRDRVFSLFSPSFSTGFLLGSLIGGQLSNPYGRLPGWLGRDSQLWQAKPYALPMLVAGACGIATCVYGYFELPETNPAVMHKEGDTGREAQHGSRNIALSFKVPGFSVITLIFGFFQLALSSFDGIWTVMTYTSVERGGLGLPVQLIGLIYTFGSALYIITTPLTLPWMKARFGTNRTLVVVFSACVALALSIPMLQFFAVNARWAMWATLGASTLFRNFMSVAWPMCDILTMAVFDPFPHLRATGSAISLIAGAFGRGFGPALSGWVYSSSTEYSAGSLGRQTAWLYMLALAVPPLALLRLLPTTLSEGGPDASEDTAGVYEALPMQEGVGDDVGGSRPDSFDSLDVVRTGTAHRSQVV